MVAYNSQMVPLGGYFYPCHVIFFRGMNSFLKFSYLSQNLSSLVVIQFMESPSKWHTLYSQSLTLPWVLLSSPNSNSLFHDRLCDTTSPSKNVTFLMSLNLDEGHAKHVGESNHPQSPQASNCLHKTMPPDFININYLCDPF